MLLTRKISRNKVQIVHCKGQIIESIEKVKQDNMTLLSSTHMLVFLDYWIYNEHCDINIFNPRKLQICLMHFPATRQSFLLYYMYLPYSESCHTVALTLHFWKLTQNVRRHCNSCSEVVNFSTTGFTVQAAAYRTFCCYWIELFPHIVVSKPRSDLCWVSHY